MNPFRKRNNYYNGPDRRVHEDQITYYDPIKYSLKIVYKPNEVDVAVQEIRTKCKGFPVIGLDCEWTPVRRKNEKPDVALLQIATKDGCCILFRTCYMNEIPNSLLMLLSDQSIIKVGVGISSDAKFFKDKFKNAVMKGCFDLRYFTRMCNVFSEKESLGGLTKSILHFDLKKDNILEYDWQLSRLKAEWVQYAALDALVGVRIFEKLLPLFHEQESEKPFQESLPSELIKQYFIHPESPCYHFLDTKL